MYMNDGCVSFGLCTLYMISLRPKTSLYWRLSAIIPRKRDDNLGGGGGGGIFSFFNVLFGKKNPKI